MATYINRKKEIIEKLIAEGKVRVCNTEADNLARERINKHAKEVRRDFLIKQAKSWQSASETFLNS